EGEPVETAITILEQLGFKTNIQEQRAAKGMPEGVVIDQNPKGGVELAKGSMVYLVVSRSKDALFLPNYVGMPLETALKELERLGIQTNIVHSDDISVSPNTVIGQDPAAGTKVARGSFITLKVSDASSAIEVPKLEGMSLNSAMKLIADLGGTIVVKEIEDKNAASGIVLRQEPEPGTKLARGDKITVYVAKTSASSVVMPNLVGKTVNAALAEAKALGLELSIEGGGSGNAKVTSQRPEAGAIVEDGKASVTSFNMAVVPSLNGMNYDAAVEKLREAGLVPGNVTASYEDNVPGIVVQQYPSSGIETDYGAAVDLTVTAAREPEPAPAPAQAPAPENTSSEPINYSPPPEEHHVSEMPAPPPPAPALPNAGESAPPTPALDLPGDLPI
ncbi:PASTA domain-containing protein, partial [bacterium]|nr:PASTA domain-containing protein [bacterium]